MWQKVEVVEVSIGLATRWCNAVYVLEEAEGGGSSGTSSKLDADRCRRSMACRQQRVGVLGLAAGCGRMTQAAPDHAKDVSHTSENVDWPPGCIHSLAPQWTVTPAAGQASSTGASSALHV